MTANENPSVIERLTTLENQVLELVESLNRLHDTQHQINESVQRTIGHLLTITKETDDAE